MKYLSKFLLHIIEVQKLDVKISKNINSGKQNQHDVNTESGERSRYRPAQINGKGVQQKNLQQQPTPVIKLLFGEVSLGQKSIPK